MLEGGHTIVVEALALAQDGEGLTRDACAEEKDGTGALLVALVDVIGVEGESVGPRSDLGKVLMYNATEAGEILRGYALEGEAKGSERHEDTSDAVAEANDVDGDVVREEGASSTKGVRLVVVP